MAEAAAYFEWSQQQKKVSWQCDQVLPLPGLFGKFESVGVKALSFRIEPLLKKKLLFSYLQPCSIVQLVRFQLGWFFLSRRNELCWNLNNEILVLLHCFTKSLPITFWPNQLQHWFYLNSQLEWFNYVENHLVYLERYPNHMIQPVGKKSAR